MEEILEQIQDALYTAGDFLAFLWTKIIEDRRRLLYALGGAAGIAVIIAAAWGIAHWSPAPKAPLDPEATHVLEISLAPTEAPESTTVVMQTAGGQGIAASTTNSQGITVINEYINKNGTPQTTASGQNPSGTGTSAGSGASGTTDTSDAPDYGYEDYYGDDTEYDDEEYYYDDYSDDDYSEDDYSDDEYSYEYSEDDYSDDEYSDDEYYEEEYYDDGYSEDEYYEDEEY